MKKIKVNHEACIGCGACVAIAPDYFEFNDEGLSKPKKQDNLESPDLQNAIDSCPTSAISVGEAQENEFLDGTNEDNCECDGCDHCGHCEE